MAELGRWALLALALCGAVTRAGEPSAPRTVAVYTLAVQSEESDRRELEALVAQQVTAQGMKLAEPSEVARFLEREAPDVCLEEYPSCLPRLAQAAHADSALLMTVSPYGSKIVVTSKWMDRSGTLLYDISRREFPKDKRPDSAAVRHAVQTAALETLTGASLDARSSDVPVAAPSTGGAGGTGAAASAPMTEKTNAWPWQMSPRRWAGLGIGAAGVASLLASGIIAIVAQSNAVKLKAEEDGSGRVNPSGLPTVQALNAQSTAATVTLSAGAALTVGGLLMFFFPTSKGAPMSVTGSPSAGGAHVEVSGAF